MTTPPRPTLDETLARIDAVLGEPEPAPLDVRPLMAVMRQRDDRIGQLLREGSWTPPSFGQLFRAFVRARR